MTGVIVAASAKLGNITVNWYLSSFLYAAKAIIEAIGSEYISFYDGTLEQFIEAAEALDMDYDYQKTDDGYDFQAWHIENQEIFARIKLWKH